MTALPDFPAINAGSAQRGQPAAGEIGTNTGPTAAGNGADRHFIAINAAQLAGHTGTAAAMLADYRHTFPTVTGRDFGRSIAWARAQPPGPLSNEGIRQHVREHKQRTAAGAQL